MSEYDEVQQRREQHRRNLQRIEEELRIYPVGERPVHLLNQRDEELKALEELDMRLAAWPRDEAGQPLPTDRDFVEVEERYRRQVARAYGYLTLHGCPERDPDLHAVPLERIFVKLTAITREPVAIGDPLEPVMIGGQGWYLEGEGPESRCLTVERKRQVSVPEAIRDYPCLVITGPPGSGKTTLLRWLALTFAEGKQAQPDRLGDGYPHERLPVLVELRKFHNRFAEERQRLTTVNLADEIAAFVAEDARFEGTPAEFVRRALANGDCLVAFDGLDEIADFAARQRASAALRAFADNYAACGNRIIITSRPTGYKGVGLGPGFQHCEINPFTPEDVSEFIHHWYEVAYPFDPATAREEADRLVEEIEGNDRVARLAQTPLLCTIIAIVYRNSRALPSRRVELYLECCKALLDTWERVKEIRQSGLIGGFDWQTKLELLAPLAYWLHSEEGRTAAPEAEFERRLADELRERKLCEEAKAEQEARAFLAAIRERSGLLQGRGDGSLEFPHLTFQEYLAARHIAAAPDMETLLGMFMPHLHEAWWREVHLLTIAHLGSGHDGAPKASALLEAILDRYEPPLRFLRAIPYTKSLGNELARVFPRWQLVRRLAWAMQRERFFAATALADCALQGVTNEGRERVIKALEETLLLAMADARWTGEDTPWLAPAASSLAQLGQVSPQVISALLQALGDGNWRVQRAAAASLAQLGQASPQAISALLEALDDDEGFAWSVADSLGQSGQASSQVISALLEALDDDKWWVRRTAAWGLGRSGQASPRVISALLKALGDDERCVREAAAESLGQLGQASPEVISALLKALGDDDWWVREAAARGLGQLDQASPEVIFALLEILGDSDGEVWWGAARSLGQLGQAGPQVIPALLEALGDNNHDVRAVVARYLGRLGQASPEVISGLLEALDDDHWWVREKAAESLGQLGQASSRVISALLKALDDDEEAVRRAAVASLGQLGQASPQVISGLLEALDDDKWWVRRAAAWGLGQSGQPSPQVISALLEALSDDEEPVRQAAAWGLGELDQASPQVISALLEALDDDHWWVRHAAVDSLGQLGQASPQVISALLKALDDGEWRVREVVARCLGHLGQASPQVISALLKALGDNEWLVRHAAAASLGQLGQDSPQVIPALLEALDDDEGFVRSVADILGQLGQASPWIIYALLRALGGSDADVRQAAAESLAQLMQATPEVLVALNRALHHSWAGVRNAAHEALTKLLEGKPIPGDKWVPLRVRRERRERRKRRGRQAALILAMALPPLAYIPAVLYLPGFQANRWILAAFAAWAGFLGTLAGMRGWWRGSRR